MQTTTTTSADPPPPPPPPPINGGGGARYKLMSPAKLPITRSPCITIPPGLSPTSFLESPVLLSCFKGEPSPTTGSFLKPQIVQSSSGGPSTVLPPGNSSDGVDISQSGSFEFKPNTGSFPIGGFSFAGALASSTNRNQQQSEKAIQIQVECQSQFLEPSLPIKDLASPRDDLTPTIDFPGAVPPEVDSNELSQKVESNNEAPESHYEHKGPGSQFLTDRTSEDGYNWRKYGQKLVKGSEYPRSYYKCSYPKCEVKKLFERSPDGQITEIIYKGTHDHPKPQPQPNRRLPNSVMSSLEETSNGFLLCGKEGKLVNSHCQTAQNNEPGCSPELSPGEGNENTGDVGVSHLNQTPDDTDGDDPFAKRRRMEVGEMDISSVTMPIREPRVVVQTVSDVDILDDGYRWRKYGQKVVRANPNPRSYYKCTHPSCPVRKHVERASHDLKSVITTYEGKHNHEVPTARNSSHDTPSTSLANRIGSYENGNQVSLDLGVGIRGASNFGPGIPNGMIPTQYNGTNLVMLQSSPFSNFHGYANNGMGHYISRENHNQGHSSRNQQANHSSNP